MLRGLGAPIEGPGDAAAALAERRDTLRRRVCEPTVVAWGGRLALDVRLPRVQADAAMTAALETEDGPHREGLALRRRGERRDGDDVIVRAALDETLPPGVHRVHVTAGAVRAATHVVAAPRRCFAGDGSRSLGVFAPLYALHSSSSRSVGDLDALRRLARWARRAGCRYVGTLPLYACYLDAPFDPSPYAPITRKYFNELFADLGSTPASPEAPPAPLVDYRDAVRRRRPALEALAEEAFATPGRRDEIESFTSADPEVDDYARFRAAVERRRTCWLDWEGPARDGVLASGDYDERSRRLHLYAQWRLHRGLDGLRGDAAAAGLYLDLPVGVHRGGYDTWRNRDRFAMGLSAGAPPDPFFSRGQDWGFAPLHPHTSRLDGHRYLRDVLARAMRVAGLLRIDHVMGLHRMFCVPLDGDATDGVYVRYPADELYAIVCLESSRHHARVVGENLGTVPRQVDRDMRRRGLLRMWVAQFTLRPEAGADHALGPIGPETLAALNTHDMIPFAGFWRGDDVAIRRRHDLLDDDGARGEREARTRLREVVVEALRRRGLLDGEAAPASILHALLQYVAGSEADVLIVNLEDLWLETEPQNVPGLDDPPPWRRRLARSLEAIESDPWLADRLRELAAVMIRRR